METVPSCDRRVQARCPGTGSSPTPLAREIGAKLPGKRHEGPFSTFLGLSEIREMPLSTEAPIIFQVLASQAGR